MNELKITVYVKPQVGAEIIGIKEDLANYLERYGDVTRVAVEKAEYRQERFKSVKGVSVQ